MNAILFDYKFNRLALFSACVSAHRLLLLLLLFLFVCQVHAPIHVANMCANAIFLRWIFVTFGGYVCVSMFFSELLFIYFLLSTSVYVAHFFLYLVVLSTLQTVIFRTFFALSLCICNACYAKAVHIKRHQIRCILFYFENGQNRYTYTCIVFNKFLSLQSQMDRLKLVNRKCTSVQCAHLAALECFGTMQKEKYGERERENELFACFTSTNAHFLFIDYT